MNKQITEDYVSYEIAKLLKEKGFDVPCRQAYFNGSLVDYTLYGFCDGELLDCPSQSLALKWLREVHNVFISSDLDVYSNLYFATVYTQLQCTTPNKHYSTELYINPKQAVEAAILYVLKNLI